VIDAWLLITKLASLCVGAGLVLIAYCVRKLIGSWYAPASIFALLWAGFIILPAVMVPTAPLNVSSLLYIFAACLVFACGVAPLLGRAPQADKSTKSCANTIFGTQTIWLCFVASTMSSISFTVGTLLTQGFTWEDLILNTLATSSKFAGMRYAEELTSTYYIQASLLTNYVASALGGFLFAVQTQTRSRVYLVVSAFLPAVLIMITQSAKGSLFLSLAYFWGAINVCRVIDGDNVLLTTRGFYFLLKSSIFVLPLIGISFYSRGMSESDGVDEIGASLSNYFSSYFFGHLYAFSDWFSNYLWGASSIDYTSNEMRFGLYTFNGLFNLIGNPEPLPQGVFDEYFSIDNLLTTNIYTWFRGLLMDFGLVGSLIFMFLIGFVAHMSFIKLIFSRRPYAMYVGYVHMTGLFVHSFLNSLLMYNSTYATFILLWIVLAVNGAIVRKSSQQSQVNYPG
jgi:oligosaccharide repeat unit polymerase